MANMGLCNESASFLRISALRPSFVNTLLKNPLFSQVL